MRYRDITIWKEAPFLRLIIPFAGGIITERFLQLPVYVLLPVLLSVMITWILLSFLPLHVRYTFRPFYGLLINAVFFITGAMLAWTQDTSLSSNSFARLYQPNDLLILKLQEPLSETKATYKTKALVFGLYREDRCIKVKGSILLYFRKDSVSANLKAGNELAVVAGATPIMNSGNPGTFDFAAYATLRGCFMQAFVSPTEYRIISLAKEEGLKSWLADRRETICAVLKDNIPGQKEAALAEALLVGYKEDLDKGLLQAYSNTGVVHVIAISGLHLGILYIILKSILTVIPFFRNHKWITSILIIVFLWLFSLLTGGSPSVIRSAVMFTSILCGESFSRKISMYNCLAASAFLLLCYKPYWFFDIGFQLSYAAVLGILVFNKPITQLLFVKNRLLDKLWQMVTVTLAAQILTTPISLFYFQQFPNYFLLANLIAVPLSSGILIGTILLCMIAFLPVIPEIFGTVLDFSIRFMNGAVEHISNLPFSVTAGINMSLPQVVVLYSLIIALSLFVHSKKKFFLFVTQLLLVVFSFTYLHRQALISRTQLLIVYNIKGKQVIEILNGKRSILTGRDAGCKDEDCGQMINAAHTRYGITSCERKSMPQFIIGEKVSVSFLKSRQDLLATPKASIILPAADMTDHAETICRQLFPVAIVLDPSHSNTSIQKWTTITQDLGISIHAVIRKGAFVKTLN